MRTLLKVVAYGTLVLVLLAGFLLYRAYDYPTYSVEFDRSEFPTVQTDKDIDQLARELIGKMTLDEKIDQLYGEKMSQGLNLMINAMVFDRLPHIYAGGNERLDIPPFAFSDGPRGVRANKKRTAGKRAGVTTFPVSMSRGASWDVELESRVYEVIAKEMRASGINYTGTPTINLLRHPAWGRAQETYSEDPWLLGEFGLAAVRSLQKHNVMSCAKHFALNSIENSRFVVDVELDERTLREVYLPHFKKVVQQGKVASLMSSYNKVLGEYAGNNHYLLTDILRNEWGFEGFVSSDWFFGTHDGVASIKAGLNVEMPFQKVYSHETLKQALEDGEIDESDIDELILATLKTRLRFGLAEDPMEYPDSLIANSESTNLARTAAEKGMVLLKNDNVLPYDKSSGKTIAVIGRLADVENTGDHGSSSTVEPYVVTPYEGIADYHEASGNSVVLDDASDLSASKALAETADEVIVVVGYSYVDEGEFLISSDEAKEAAKLGRRIGGKRDGGDRESLKLLPEDEELIQALANSNENLVVVYVGGSGIDMSAWDYKVPAILFAWYSGMEGGNALANILYGDVNPGGKLPFSIAKKESDYPYFTPYTEKITYGYYHGYTLFDKKGIEVAYPFGFGLSYTSYEYGDVSVLTPVIGKDASLMVEVPVTNTGLVEGEEVVQMYVGFSQSSVDRPVKLLRDFEKVPLKPGETRTVRLEVAAEDMAWYNPEAKGWEIEQMTYEVYVGSSSASSDLLRSEFAIQ